MNNFEQNEKYSNQDFEDVRHIDENGIESLRVSFPDACVVAN